LTLSYHRNPAEVNWEILINDLIADDFHNGRTVAQLRASFENSQVQAYAMVGDRCIGTARALSDGIGNAYVVDVWTQSTYRNQGIAQTRMEIPINELTDDTRDMHRAITSLMEELEAVDWYNQRVDACKDEDLKAILIHNRDEEKEHAAMVLEWIRRKDPTFDSELKDYLFTEKPIAHK